MVRVDIERERMERASDLKRSFADVHSRISQVEKKMNELNDEASLLIEELSNLRQTEMDFIKDLSREYGPGKLDPFEMKWIKED